MSQVLYLEQVFPVMRVPCVVCSLYTTKPNCTEGMLYCTVKLYFLYIAALTVLKVCWTYNRSVQTVHFFTNCAEGLFCIYSIYSIYFTKYKIIIYDSSAKKGVNPYSCTVVDFDIHH